MRSGSELIELFATFSQLLSIYIFIFMSFESKPSKYYLNLNQISRPPETPRATKGCTHVKFWVKYASFFTVRGWKLHWAHGSLAQWSQEKFFLVVIKKSTTAVGLKSSAMALELQPLVQHCCKLSKLMRKQMTTNTVCFREIELRGGPPLLTKSTNNPLTHNT